MSRKILIDRFSHSLIGFGQKRGRAIISLFLFIVIAGIYAAWSIPKESDPDISIPIMYVTVKHDGISPEDAEQLLVKPIEQEVSSVEGANDIISTSYEGGANVLLKFQAGFDAKQALIDVREAVDKAKVSLPEESDEPKVVEINLSLFPVLAVMLYGNIDEDTLDTIAEDLKDSIENIPEVLEVNISGAQEEAIDIIITPEKLEAYNLDALTISQSIKKSNLLVAAGALNQNSGRFQIKVPGLITDAQQLLDIPLIANNNRVVLLKDIAHIERSHKETTTLSRVNGQRAITLEVKKRTGENIIAVTEQVKDLLVEEAKKFPPQLQYITAQDRSVGIRDMLRELSNNILSAVILVILIVLLFLGVAPSFLVGISIPGSFLGGMLIIYLMGFSINVVVLFALILSVGLLVDGAIVVAEYAARRLKEGDTPVQAFDQAARQMSWPIIASTATTLSAFLPLIFWPGIVGEFMKFLPITLIAVLVSSLFMALFFMPILGTWMATLLRAIASIIVIALSSAIGAQALGFFGGIIGFVVGVIIVVAGFFLNKKRQLKAVNHDDANDANDADIVEQQPSLPASSNPQKLSWLVRAYSGLLHVILRNVVITCGVILLVFGVLGGIFYYYKNHNNGVEFFPSNDPDRFNVSVSARGNLSLDDKNILVSKVERIVLDIQKNHYGISSINTIIGKGNDDGPADVIGQIQVELTDWRNRPLATTIIEPIIQRSSHIKGIKVEVAEEKSGPRSGKPVNLELKSYDRVALYKAGYAISKYMATRPNLKEISESLPLPQFNWRLEVDKAEAAKYGVGISEIGLFVKLLTQGFVASNYRPVDKKKEVDIIVRYPKNDRTLHNLNNIKINTKNGAVPLSYFVSITPIKDTGELKRISGIPVVNIEANIHDGFLANDEIAALKQQFTSDPALAALLQDITWDFVGEQENQKESEQFLMSAFAASICLMLAILIWQFNSFSSALFILSAVIMSSCGVLLGLLVTGQPFGIIMSGIGLISLAGIVVNNNIVLIDTYDVHRRAGMQALPALLLTCQQRFRPVMLTAITTIFGLLPMALAMNIDLVNSVIEIDAPSTALWTQISTSIVFGLLFALPLTLIITPCFIMLRERILDSLTIKKNADIEQSI